MKEYNKLVRDRIPEIIKKAGKKAVTEKASGPELESLLLAKLDEEVQEYKDSASPEELADILEVVYAIAIHLHNLSIVDLEKIRLQKQRDRGGFDQGLILKKVYP